MDELVEILAFLLSITALISVFSLLITKLYFKIRRCFPISVNCWFCNTWTWVHYDNQNSFDCPGCLQYNGFTEDGGYNKVIEAQHRFIKTSPGISYKNSNGLCSSCNQNQQLKITQLAKFTPLVEENYDEEIEHFRKQLEKAYELCTPCSRLLRTKLLREKATFLGNQVLNIKRKGINIYERLIKKSNAYKSQHTLLEAFKFFQGSLAILVILHVTSDVLNGLQTDLFPSKLLPYLEIYQDISTSILSVLNGKFLSSSIPFTVGDFVCGNLWIYSAIGFFIQLSVFSLEETLMCIKINQFLCWSFLAVISWNKTAEMLMSSFQIVCACLIFYNSFFGFSTNLPTKITMKKLPSSCEKDCDINYSDNKEDSTPSYNARDYSFHNNKTENITAKNLYNIYPNVRSNSKTSHLNKTLFKLDVDASSMPSCSISPKHKQRPISPSELNYSEQNSWVGGGFWKNDDGTIVPINPNATSSYSQSSGIFSQTSENFVPVFNSNKFNSLPGSIETSLSGDFDLLSLAPKSPRLVSPSASPPNNSSSSHNSHNSWTSSPNFLRFKASSKPLGLFKLDNLELSSPASNSNSTYTGRNFGTSRSSL